MFLSTLLSPITTPAVLHAFGFMTSGDYSSDLHELAQQGTNVFMASTVVLPSLLGIAAHFVLGDSRTEKLKPSVKLINFALLLLLNYSNAATALPNSVRFPDWDFLEFVFFTTAALCVIAFGAGFILAKMFRTGQSEKAALMFGLGMNNNGTGLVLAGMTLADHPAVMLPMIFYTLTQQMVAALVDKTVFRRAD